VEIEILNQDRLRYWSGRLKLPEMAVNELERIAALTAQDETLRPIFQEFYERIAVRGEWEREAGESFIDPQVTAKLGQANTLFYLLAYMGGLPQAEKEYIRRGIDRAVFDATMADICTWLVHCYTVYGRWMFNQFHWISNHLSCDLFRLGRMQYQLSRLETGITALRRKSSAEYVILADPNVPLRADGYASGAGDLPPAGEPWQAVFAESETGWRGNMIAPRGYALRDVQFFPRSEWDLALQKGDTVLDLHIPRNDRFSMEDCQESLRQAFQFFARFYPERPFKACACHTWFFSPQLQQIAPPDSNIVRFQREFYLYPFTGSLAFLWFYVFGEGVKVNDRAAAPDKTSLQRAVLEWIDSGGEIFDLPGLMFHSPDEWGTQPYMRRFEAKGQTS
jgi:hypothetical protein